jgi:glycosyltransferase involved in cell wall biosynthesis
MSNGNAQCVVVSDALNGGAATATNRLVDALVTLSEPIQRWHFTCGSRRPDTPWEISLDPGCKRPPLERIVKNFSLPLANRMRHRRHTQAFLSRIAATRPALLNLHNIHDCGLDHAGLLELPPGIKLTWTIHDCWPFCTTAFRWHNSNLQTTETTCDDRPEAPARERRDRFFSARRDVVLVAPSKWIASEARRQVDRETRIEIIPYGVDTQFFAPQPAAPVRDRLGLAAGRTWLGYSSTWASTRKGTDILCAAMTDPGCRNLGLLMWGEVPKFDWPQGVEVKSMGPVSDPAVIRDLYAACDLFICPSRADNLPNAVLESLACGTPVVGSNVGGIPDMVRPGQSGWLFEADQPAACAAAIRSATQAHTDWPRYRDNCRRLAVDEYGTALQAQRYARLFHELLSR